MWEALGSFYPSVPKNITWYGQDVISLCLLHTVGLGRRGEGAFQRAEKQPGGFTAPLTPSFPLPCAETGNQQEAPFSQTPGGVSHPTSGPTPSVMWLLKHWPTLLCSHSALTPFLLLCSGTQMQEQRQTGRTFSAQDGVWKRRYQINHWILKVIAVTLF